MRLAEKRWDAGDPRPISIREGDVGERYPRERAEVREECGDGATHTREHKPRRDVGQGREDEGALVQARVWHGQVGRVEREGAVAEEVEVERTRRIGE